MHFRSLICTAVCVLAFLMPIRPVPCSAQETDSGIVLSSLLPELKHAYQTALESDSLLIDNSQRKQQLASMVKAADEVTVMLYTQKPGFAFDMAFALEKVSKVYDSFKVQARLSDKYLISSRSGLRQYSLLGETLRDMYINHRLDSLMVTDTLLQSLPQLDSLMVGDSILVSLPPLEPILATDDIQPELLDSCLYYTNTLTALYGRSVVLALQDSICFAETERRLQQAYDYAQSNYSETQKHIFIGGNISIIQIIRNWDSFIANAKSDLETRFGGEPPQSGDKNPDRPLNSRNILGYAAMALVALLLAFLVAALINLVIFKFVKNEKARNLKPVLTAILSVLLFILCIILVKTDGSDPYWKMAYRLLSLFSWLTLAIFISLLIRVDGNQARASRNIYIPTLLLAFFNILLRAIFLPASLVPLILPAALLVFSIWQAWLNIRYRGKVTRADIRYMWVSVGVMVLAGILSLTGYSMLGVLLLTFWTFQLALLHTISMLYHLMKRYYQNRVTRKKARFHMENPLLPLTDKADYIEVTWLYDLLKMVVVPIAILLSIPFSIQLTIRTYQLSLTGTDFLRQSLFTREGLQEVTPLNILVVLALFFIFRYLIYLVIGSARLFKMRNIIDKKHAAGIPLKESDVNFSLTNTIVSVVGWLLYLLIVSAILRMPTSALTTIGTGLAAGVGFALKDLINNFFYGVQLMAGRIRVGDKISCDGIRGTVKRVSYQTTLVEEEDGSMIAFTNTDLFTKKFKNLNSGKNYELLRIPVGVKYGTDIEKARNVILQTLEPLRTQDKSGRDVVDPSFPIDVRFDGFGNSCINLVVTLYTTVETHYTFPSRAKEAIYNAFAQNGIEIPFPQQDVYIKSIPDSKQGQATELS